MIVTTAFEALAAVQSGNRVFVHGAAMTPTPLIEALVAHSARLKNVEMVHIHTEGQALYADPAYRGTFSTNCCFVGGNLRKAVNSGDADYIPVFLSDIPALFRANHLPVDVALIQVSPPDKHGYCSLGVSVDIALAAVQTAKTIIAEINPRVPRAHGEGQIHVSQIDFGVESNRPIYAHEPEAISELEAQIGRNIAGLVEDGSTLQMGIGGIPNAVLTQLSNHKRLGVHTEMFADGLIPLVQSGVVTNEEKKVARGRIVACFAVGGQALYDFIDDNPIIEMRESSFTNDTAVIRKNPRVVAINSALEIDLTGQVCADTIGTKQFSGVGGQMDFIRGAALSPGGKPIIAMPSTTNKGESKIVAMLKPGADVTTTRAHVHYVVTEFGVAFLFGKNLRQRTEALINIAHPDHRELLASLARERFGAPAMITV